MSMDHSLVLFLLSLLKSTDFQALINQRDLGGRGGGGGVVDAL